MKVDRGWLGLMGLSLSLLAVEEAGASTFTRFRSSEANFAVTSSCRLCLNPAIRMANKALALENHVKPQDKAAPLGSVIKVTPKVESSSPATQQKMIESIRTNQKPVTTPDLGILDKFKPKFDQGVEIIYRLDDR